MVLRNVDGSVNLLHSKEGVTQGGTLAMIAYGIGIHPFICKLRTAYPHITKPWYAYDACTKRMFDVLHDQMKYLMVRGTTQGYLPKPTKRILLVSPRNLQRAEAHF